MTDLETIDTKDLIDELRRRSSVFFCCMRPLAKMPNYDYSRAWGVDGNTSADVPEAFARVLGLIEIVKFDMLHGEAEHEL